jgi:hypothetical protein
MSQGQNVILVVIDRFTKIGHFIPLSHPYTASVVANMFSNHVFKLHGLPRTIVTDRDPMFVSYFWKAFFLLQGSLLLKPKRLAQWLPFAEW